MDQRKDDGVGLDMAGRDSMWQRNHRGGEMKTRWRALTKQLRRNTRSLPKKWEFTRAGYESKPQRKTEFPGACGESSPPARQRAVGAGLKPRTYLCS